MLQLVFNPKRLIFIDETGANTKMARRFGRAQRGERLIDAKLKQLLRSAAKRTFEELWDFIGGALLLFSAQECSNYFRNSGYV